MTRKIRLESEEWKKFTAFAKKFYSEWCDIAGNVGAGQPDITMRLIEKAPTMVELWKMWSK